MPRHNQVGELRNFAVPYISIADQLDAACGNNLQHLLVGPGVNHALPILRDPQSKLAHAMGVMGLPVTVILNPEGQEVARLIGDADWDSDSAKAVLGALVAGQ